MRKLLVAILITAMALPAFAGDVILVKPGSDAKSVEVGIDVLEALVGRAEDKPVIVEDENGAVTWIKENKVKASVIGILTAAAIAWAGAEGGAWDINELSDDGDTHRSASTSEDEGVALPTQSMDDGNQLSVIVNGSSDVNVDINISEPSE